MSSTTGPLARGTAMTSGLLPMHASAPPHAGILGMVLVQQMPMKPASAACHPYVPARIQWLVLPKATHPMPCSRLSARARSIEAYALRLPGPRCPSHRSSAPKRAIRSGSASGMTTPLRIIATKRGNRLMPCVYTPSQVVSVKSRAHIWARCAVNPSLRRTDASCCSTSSKEIRFMEPCKQDRSNSLGRAKQG